MKDEIARECILMLQVLNPIETDASYALEVWLIPAGQELYHPHAAQISDIDRWGVTISADGESIFGSVIGDTIDEAVDELHKNIQKDCLDTANELLRFVHD